MNTQNVSPTTIAVALHDLSKRHINMLLDSKIMNIELAHIYQQPVDQPVYICFVRNQHIYSIHQVSSVTAKIHNFIITHPLQIDTLIHAVVTNTCTESVVAYLKDARARTQLIDPFTVTLPNLCLFPTSYIDDDTIGILHKLSHPNTSDKDINSVIARLRTSTYAFLTSHIKSTIAVIGHQDNIIYPTEVVISKASTDLLISMTLLNLDITDVMQAVTLNHNAEL